MQLVGEGGMIELEIPPELSYGSAAPAATFPPNATLHFIVELIHVKPSRTIGADRKSAPFLLSASMTTSAGRPVRRSSFTPLQWIRCFMLLKGLTRVALVGLAPRDRRSFHGR